MNFTKTGMNLSAVNNMTTLNLDTTSFTPNGILSSAINTLNSEAGIWLVAIIFIGLYVMFMWTLSENSPFATFRYSYLRGSLLSLILINLISITMLSAGIIWSFRIVAIFVLINAINTILVLSLDN